MTPLHMHHGGATLSLIGLVISIHVLGMYAFAPVVGRAADRWGSSRVLGAGAFVLLAALSLAGGAPMGGSWRIGIGLFLLGLGWSLCTVAASAMLTEAAPIESRTDVQGAADLVMNLAAASAGGIAGVVVDWKGFGALNGLAAVLVLGVALAVLLARPHPEVTVGS
jgi:MFS family permease